MNKPKVAAAKPQAQRLSEAKVREVSVEAPSASPGHLNEEQDYLNQVLGDLEYLHLKETSVEAQQADQTVYQTTLRAQVSKPRLSAPSDRLMGIIGHCGLPGHIAHFYNLQAEIEKHIRTASEFEDQRFVAAYDYLKAHPSTEAVFVYENRMIAARRVGGRFVSESIIAG